MASSPKPYVRIVSRCTVKPASMSDESRKPYYLTPWDLPSLNYDYIQTGLLFNKPDQAFNVVVDRLKNALAATLTHFYPMSGRFVTRNIQNPPSYCVYVDCKDPAGADFIHAVAPGVTVSDILTPTDIPTGIINSLFALPPRTPNNHAHTVPLLLVQVTQLLDGIFIAFHINHALVDGISFWHFINCYSEVCRSASQHLENNNCVLSRPPLFLNSRTYIPGSHPPDDPVFLAPPRASCRQRVFHFTSKAIALLKAKANAEYGTTAISSYQALVALIWRSTTRARGFRTDQMTTCAVPIDCRPRQEPPLPRDYFGNCFMVEYVSCRADELLGNNLGWAAGKLHDRITSFDNQRVRLYMEQFSTADCTVDNDQVPGILWLGNSPRMDVYGIDFGWGSPIASRSCDDLVDGIVHVYPGRDEGSVDVIMCLFSEFMNTLELDQGFTGTLSKL